MSSLIELVEQVNQGEAVDSAALDIYQDSANSAEKFLAHHAAARLGLKRCRTHLLEALEAIGYADEKVLRQYLAVAGFLGQDEAKAAPIARFAESAIERGSIATGIEALSWALRDDAAQGNLWSGDSANQQQIAALYADAAARTGWCQPPELNWNNKQTRVALILGQIADDDAATSAAIALANHLDTKRFKLFVYATEADARREGGFGDTAGGTPSARRGKNALDALDRAKATAWIAPTDTDAATAAKVLADRCVEDKIDVTLFDTAPADAVASLAAHWPISRAKATIRRDAALPGMNLGATIFPDAVAFEREQNTVDDARHIAEGIDPQAAAGDGPKRGNYGIPDSATVLAAVGEAHDIGDEFAATAIDLLRNHGNAILLLIGGGDWSKLKRRFEATGVAKRVGFVGKRRDLARFLKIADVVLAPFPAADPAGVLRAMAAGRPTVAALWGDSPEQSAAATLVGTEAMIAGRDPAAFRDRVAKLIRDPGYRTKLGDTLRQRAEKHFSAAETARSFEHLFDELLQRAAETDGPMSIAPEPTTPKIAAA
jgi:predicted O-linked N-acetylglucosamine transferase (SPINDLY family)